MRLNTGSNRVIQLVTLLLLNMWWGDCYSQQTIPTAPFSAQMINDINPMTNVESYGTRVYVNGISSDSTASIVIQLWSQTAKLMEYNGKMLRQSNPYKFDFGRDGQFASSTGKYFIFDSNVDKSIAPSITTIVVMHLDPSGAVLKKGQLNIK